MSRRTEDKQPVAPSTGRRRLLAVAYAFPPAAPIGTMRTLRLVRRLDADGWSTTVLTVSPRTYPSDMPLDDALLPAVPGSVDVVRAGIWRGLTKLIALAPRRAGKGTSAPAAARPGSAPRDTRLSAGAFVRRIYNSVDELTSIPDKESGWLIPAVVAGLVAIVRTRPTVLYSSAPPWTGQLVALTLARMSGLPWVADFRDPWARAPWRENQPARIRRAAVRLEGQVVRRADAVLFATRANRDEYAAHYGSVLARKFHVVANGCDPQEFEALRGITPARPWVLLHAGSLYGARSPLPLLRAVAAAVRSGALSPETFRLRFIGAATTGSDFPAAAAALGLDGIVEFLPRMPRRDILKEMAASGCLLVLQPGTTVSVPGKLYEYLAVGRPILALCEPGETSDLVRESGLGLAVAPADEAAIEAALLQLVAATDPPLAFPPARLYDGNVTAGQAAAIIERLAQAQAMSAAEMDEALEIRNG
jgi:glycosyltransferase involved in cell wall biosynthesis